MSYSTAGFASALLSECSVMLKQNQEPVLIKVAIGFSKLKFSRLERANELLLEVEVMDFI